MPRKREGQLEASGSSLRHSGKELRGAANAVTSRCLDDDHGLTQVRPHTTASPTAVSNPLDTPHTTVYARRDGLFGAPRFAPRSIQALRFAAGRTLTNPSSVPLLPLCAIRLVSRLIARGSGIGSNKPKSPSCPHGPLHRTLFVSTAARSLGGRQRGTSRCGGVHRSRGACRESFRRRACSQESECKRRKINADYMAVDP